MNDTQKKDLEALRPLALLNARIEAARVLASNKGHDQAATYVWLVASLATARIVEECLLQLLASAGHANAIAAELSASVEAAAAGVAGELVAEFEKLTEARHG